MLQILLEVPDEELFEGGLAAARSEKLSFSEYVQNLIRRNLNDDQQVEDPPVTTPPETIEQILAQAVNSARNLSSGTDFLLANLFTASRDRWTWPSLSIGDRKQLGKLFRKAMEESGVAVWVRRRSDNHAVYRRT
jgi:hypothetical protein